MNRTAFLVDELAATWVLPRLLDFCHGRESRPECFDLPVSHSIALRRRDFRSSSSSVARGRTNSRETPPGA